MTDAPSSALLLGATLSAAAALAHLACIAIGAPAYRFMGAGERVARAVEAKKLRPALVTLAITCVLLLFAAYALSGAGVIATLPFTWPALAAVSAVYLGRALFFPLLKPRFPENSDRFWWTSSGLCAVMGVLHAYGTLSLWP